MLKRLIEVLKWLPKAPTGITNQIPNGTVCDYCGTNKNHLTNYVDVYCICCVCAKKAFDKVLKENLTVTDNLKEKDND